MDLPSINEIASLLTIVFAVCGALVAAFWLSLVIWAFRDMRRRSRDPLAQLMAALLVAVLPFVGIFVYLILRPPETLAERYERALEEEALLQEIEQRPRCPNCGRVADERWQICATCHEPLKVRCHACGQLLERTWVRCPFCAAAQRPVEGFAKRPTERSAPVVQEPVEPPVAPADVDVDVEAAA